VEDRRRKILDLQPDAHDLDPEIEQISEVFESLKHDLPSLMSQFLFVVKRQLVVMCIVLLPFSPFLQL